MAMLLPRQERRKGFTDPVRISLLEDDADTVEDRQLRIDAKLDSIKNWLVGGAITFAFTALGAAANLVLALR